MDQLIPSLVTLRCLEAPLFRLTVARPVSILGRSARCDLIVDDASISREHAEIRVRQNRLLLSDLRSRNGTFVDGLRIGTAEVEAGQRLRFGKISFIIEDPEQLGLCSDEETDNAASNARVKTAHAMPANEILSQAQRRVFELLLSGNPEKHIARRLSLSQHTVHNHVRAILRIYGVHSRIELLAAFVQLDRDGG